jgi:hypothetical protein
VGPVATLIVVFPQSLVATHCSAVLSPSSILAAAHFPSSTMAAYKPSWSFRIFFSRNPQIPLLPLLLSLTNKIHSLSPCSKQIVAFVIVHPLLE